MKLPTMREIRILQALSEGKTMRHLEDGKQLYVVANGLIKRGFIEVKKNYAVSGNPTVYYRTAKGTQLLELLK